MEQAAGNSGRLSLFRSCLPRVSSRLPAVCSGTSAQKKKRFHKARPDAEIYFATNHLAEAKLVANEVGFTCVVVRGAADADDCELVYDAAFNTELPLEW